MVEAAAPVSHSQYTSQTIPFYYLKQRNIVAAPYL